MRKILRPAISIILVICSAALFVSCANGEKGVGVRFDSSKAKSFIESEVVASVTAIPLETAEMCLLSGRSGVICHKGDYIIYEHDKAVRRFDSSGRFLNDIGRIGKAPDEYMYIHDVHMKGDTLCFKDIADKKCKHYTACGKFVLAHDYKYERGLLDSVNVGDTTYKLYFYDHDKGYRLAEVRHDSVVRTLLPVETRNLEIGFGGVLGLMGVSGEKVYFTEFFSDEIMSVSDEGVRSEYIFDMGPYAAPEGAEAMSSEAMLAYLQSGKIAVNGLLEVTDRYMTLLRSVSEQENVSVYMIQDLDSGKWSFVISRDDAFSGLPCFNGDDEIIFIAPASKVLGMSGLSNPEALEGLDENSNPVILRVKLK